MKHHYMAIITLLLSSFLILPICDGAISWGKTLNYVDNNSQFTLKICDIVRKRKAQMNIVHRNGDKESLMTISEKLNLNILDGCMAEFPCMVRSLDLFPVEPVRSSSSLNIFFVTSAAIASRVIDYLNPNQPWKQSQRYLFVWLLPELNDLKKFFLQAWDKNILHAVAAVDAERVFTFEPFTSEGFRLKRVGEEHPTYFYDKLRNFHHYQLRITMFTDPTRAVPLTDSRHRGYKGVDGRVAATLVNVLNATAIYITPKDNQTYGALINGTFSGSLKDIHSGLAHIGFNLRYTLDHVKQHVEELYPYQRRQLYLIVPAAKIKPVYTIFVQAFSTSLWRLLLLSFVVILGLFMLMQYLVDRLARQTNHQFIPKSWRWYELIEMFLKTLLGEPVEGFSRISSLREFLIAWILFGYVLTSMYFAKLESSFVYPGYEPELDNLEDLPQLKVPIKSYDTVFEAIKVSLQPQYYQFIMLHSVRIPLTTSVDEYFAITQKNKNIAIIVHDELGKLILARTYNDAINRPSFHIVKEYLRSLTTSYVLTKGSPFIHKFQTVVSAFHEFGLMQHWLQLELQPSSLYTQKSEEFFEDLEDGFDLNTDEDGNGADAFSPPVQPARKKKIVLNLDILQGSFYLWLGGILISCIGFLAEWWHWWRSSKRVIVNRNDTESVEWLE